MLQGVSHACTRCLVEHIVRVGWEKRKGVFHNCLPNSCKREFRDRISSVVFDGVLAPEWRRQRYGPMRGRNKYVPT